MITATDTDDTGTDNFTGDTPLTPEPGGIDTVTLESGGKSVTLTDEQFANGQEALAAVTEVMCDDTNLPTINTEDTAMLFKLRERLRLSEVAEGRAAEAHKSAKKHKESQQDELNRFIDELEHPDPPTLFDNAENPDRGTPGDAAPASTTAGDESWRSATASELGISDAIIDKLAANEPMLDTLGAIIDYTTAGKRLTDIAGIGAAKAEAIDAAIEKYFVDHPRPAPARDESWRETALTEIGVTGEQAQAFWNLKPMPLMNLGQIADWLDVDGNTLSSIGALDETTIKKILAEIEKARA